MKEEIDREWSKVEEGANQTPELSFREDEVIVIVESEGRNNVQIAGRGGGEGGRQQGPTHRGDLEEPSRTYLSEESFRILWSHTSQGRRLQAVDPSWHPGQVEDGNLRETRVLSCNTPKWGVGGG